MWFFSAINIDKAIKNIIIKKIIIIQNWNLSVIMDIFNPPFKEYINVEMMVKDAVNHKGIPKIKLTTLAIAVTSAQK